MWKDLTMAQKSELMKIFIKSGITSTSEMASIYDKNHSTSYNSFATRGNMSDGGNLFYDGGEKDKWWQLDAEKIYNRVPAHENELGKETYSRYLAARRLPIWEGARDYYKNGSDDLAEQLYDYYTDILHNPYSEEVVEEHLNDYPNSKFQVYNEDGLNIDETAYNIKQYAQAYLGHEDAKDKYLGFPQRGNTVIESLYKPTNAKNNNQKYFKFSYQTPYYWQEVIDDMVNYNRDTKQYIDRTLNTFTAGRGVDSNKGEYISIYDIWDYNPMIWGGGNDRVGKYVNGQPFEIYDRVYLDNLHNVNTAPESGTYYGRWLPEVRIVESKSKKKNGGHLSKLKLKI